MKGDVSGIAQPGEKGGPVEKRAAELGQDWEPTGFPDGVLLDRRVGPGVPVRATVSDFGPLLLATVLEANETQEQGLSLVFATRTSAGFCPSSTSPTCVRSWPSSTRRSGKAELKTIGGVSATIGVLLRSLAQLSDGGGNDSSASRSSRRRPAAKPDGRGIISCLELPAVQDKPRLFSTVHVWLLAEFFEQLPEVGDIPKPKLVFFFDEAHLLFDEATEAFLDSVVQTVRLIRSKGRPSFTQTPGDIPGDSPAQPAGSARPARLTAAGREGP